MAEDQIVFKLVVRDDGTATLDKFTDGVAKAQGKVKRSAGRMSRAFRGLTRGINRLPGAIFNFRNALLGVAIGAGMRKVIQTFGGFEKQMNRVAALTGEVVGPTFERMEAQARRLGETTVFSAREAADAMAFLSMAGFEAEEVMAALPKTLELAASAGIDLGTSADIVTNILTGLQIPIEDLGRANDVLVQAFTSSNISLTQLGEAFKFVGPVATSAGLQFEEVTAAIGLLGNAGIQGSMAGTTLRAAIAKLLDPSKEATETLERLGVVVTDAAGNMLPLNQIIQQLGDSGAKTADLFRIFGLRAGPGMAALVSQGADKLREMTAELEKSGGRAKQVADVQMRGLTGALVRLRSATEGMFIDLGELLAPAMISVADAAKVFAGELGLAFKAIRAGTQAVEVFTGTGFREFLDSITPSAERITDAFFFLGKVVIGLKFAFDKGREFVLQFALGALRVAKELNAAYFDLRIFLEEVFVDVTKAVGKSLTAVLTGTSNFIVELGVLAAELPSRKAQEFGVRLINVSTSLIVAAAATDELTRASVDTEDILSKQAATTEILEQAIDAVNLAIVSSGEKTEVTVAFFNNWIEAQRQAQKALVVIRQNADGVNDSVAKLSGTVGRASSATAGLDDEIKSTIPALKLWGRVLGEAEAQTITSFSRMQFAVEAFSASFQNSTVQDLNAFLAAQSERVNSAETAGAREIALNDAKWAAVGAVTGAALGAITKAVGTEGEAAFRINQAIGIANAVVSTAVGVAKALELGPILGPVLAGVIAAIGAVQIATIASAKPGGGGAGARAPGGGGAAAGGGAAVAAAPERPAEAAPERAPQQINISVSGFVGNEAELASQLSNVIRDAVRDDVDFGLETSS